MGSVNTPRLYRKASGTYFLRVILHATSPDGSSATEKRTEARYSLRTKNPAQARKIAAWANAKLAQVISMKDRKDVLAGIGAGIKTWTIGDLTVDGPEDQQRFEGMLQKFPDFRAALMERISNTAEAQTRYLEMNALIEERTAQHLAALSSAQSHSGPPPANTPAKPMRMSDAIARFATSKQSSAANTSRTARDKKRLLEILVAHVVAECPALGPDPLVHELETNHLSSFLDAVPVRSAVHASPDDKGSKFAAPRTVIKKISDLRSFFDFAHHELRATTVDPTTGLNRRSKALKSAATRLDRHYDPFNDEHLKQIFEPKAYLAFNRASDYFWAPLLGLHLGTRLKELMTLRLDAIEHHEPTDIWYVDVTPEHAKNSNSIRRLPITQPLVDLGFIKYVEHVRRLGAIHLFPHRDWSSPTFKSDPSKNCSRHFGSYLDELGLTNTALVFHSFRHTVVSALQDNNVPLADSMQITGHTAQEHAVKNGKVTQREAASVHISTYTHADKPRLNVEYPLARLKEHLERSVRTRIDYAALGKAAEIVREHTQKAADGFKSGWPKLRQAQTAQLLDRLAGR